MTGTNRTINSRFWTDRRVLKMPAEGRLLFLYLVTNPQSHLSGIYIQPRMMISYQTGLEVAKVDSMCDLLTEMGLCKFDKEVDIIWVVRMAKYQMLGPKMQRAAAKQLLTLHDSPLINEFLETYPQVKRFYSTTHDVSREINKPEDSVIPIPHKLDTPGFREMWAKWVGYRKQIRRTLKETTIEFQFKMLVNYPVEVAIAMISQSITSGWEGIFEVRGHGKEDRKALLPGAALSARTFGDGKSFTAFNTEEEVESHEPIDAQPTDA